MTSIPENSAIDIQGQDFAALKQRFNPEGSLLRRHQLKMLEMLQFVDRVCKKYGITYSLSGGTLLGAVRHKGFIPWDDDLDIELLRAEYLRLIEVLPKELPGEYILQTNETDANYIFPFAKIRDRDSFLAESNDYDRIFTYRGIYIDIFPIEPIPVFFKWIGGHLQGQIFNQLNRNRGDEAGMIRNVRRIYRFNDRIAFPFLRFLSRLFPVKALRDVFGTAFLTPRYGAELFPQIELEFEGCLFPAPHNYNAYLTRYYGDYMRIPAIEDLVPHVREVRLGSDEA